MVKKRVSSIHLSWHFFEAMRDDAVFQKGVSVAIVPDPELGWRAVVAAKQEDECAGPEAT